MFSKPIVTGRPGNPLSAQVDEWYDPAEERTIIPGRGINSTQAASLIGVPASTIRTWLERGVIPLKRNRRGLIDGLDLWAWAEQSGLLRKRQLSETLAASSAYPESPQPASP